MIVGLFSNSSHAASKIVHDTEYYILEAQNGEQWAKDDKTVDEKLAAFRKKNGGKPPNIIYILVDDIGFGDLGIPEMNAIRGYKTFPTLMNLHGKVCVLRACTPSHPVPRPASPS